MASFQLCSDLHFEMRGGLRASPETYPKRAAPILVIAGDLYPAGAPEFKEILRRVAEPYEMTLYIPGNHEFYGYKGEMKTLERKIADTANSLNRVFCLNQKSLDIAGITFIGATMWTDPPKELWSSCTSLFNDYHSIKQENGTPYTPEKLYSVHKRHGKFLEKALSQSKKNPQCNGAVIVTHHAPDRRLSLETASRPKGLFPFYFASDMKSMVDDPYVKVWCHGHSHESHCVRLEPWGPIFASNAKGYPGEKTGYTNAACISLNF